MIDWTKRQKDKRAKGQRDKGTKKQKQKQMGKMGKGRKKKRGQSEKSWTEGRQAEVRLRSGGTLGALFSLEVKAGLKEDSRGEA